MDSVLQMPSMQWRRLAVASLALVTLFAIGVPSAYAIAPTATDDDFTTDEDTPLAGNVTEDNGHGADADVDGTLVPNVQLVTDVTQGSLTLNTDGTFSYTPTLDYFGTDTFTYTVEDNDTETSLPATATITITDVNDPPTAADDDFATDEDTPLAGNVTEDNGHGADADVDGTLVPNVQLVTDVTHGSLTLNTDGTFDYTPTLDYFGTDTFTYTVEDNDGGTSPEATVTITVTDVNDVPTAANDSFTTDEDTALTDGNVTADNGYGADTDIDGTLVPNVLLGGTDVANGSLTLNTDGTFSYSPNSNWHGIDTFTYTVEDNDGGTSPEATVTITVNSVYDPPVAPAPAFDDLDGLSDEAIAAIRTLVDLGVTTGTDDTSFSPAMITERWQMALFLTRVLTATGTALPTVEWSFSDVDGFSVDAQTAMNQLAYLGISVGTSTEAFSPAGYVTRQEMALFLVRTLDASGTTLPTAGVNQFTDLAESSAEVQDAVDVLVTLGITNGTTDTTFSPNDGLPRWQMALFLARVIEVIQAG